MNADVAAQDLAAGTLDAIATRRSVRGFSGADVPGAVIREMLELSSRAPSGTNMQPWRAYVLTGDTKQRLCEAVLEAHYSAKTYQRQYRYYPEKFFEPYLGRRRQVGWALYALCGIERGETRKMKDQHARNFTFFDAPVGMIFTIDARLEIGSWLDIGMFLENLMIAARAFGLHTCPQAAWANFHTVIREVLDLPEGEAIVCGMALGYEDRERAENALRTPRAPLEEWASFRD